MTELERARAAVELLSSRPVVHLAPADALPYAGCVWCDRCGALVQDARGRSLVMFYWMEHNYRLTVDYVRCEDLLPAAR